MSVNCKCNFIFILLFIFFTQADKKAIAKALICNTETSESVTVPADDCNKPLAAPTQLDEESLSENTQKSKKDKKDFEKAIGDEGKKDIENAISDADNERAVNDMDKDKEQSITSGHPVVEHPVIEDPVIGDTGNLTIAKKDSFVRRARKAITRMFCKSGTRNQ